MSKIEVSYAYAAPVDKVFAVFSNLEQLTERITGIIKLEVLTEGPMKLGTRWRETRVMFGKESTEEMWVTDFQPSQGYVVEAESHGAHYTSTYVFESEGAGAKVTMTFEGKPLTIFAKIMHFVMMPLMKKSLCKALDQDMTDLKKYIEG